MLHLVCLFVFPHLWVQLGCSCLFSVCHRNVCQTWLYELYAFLIGCSCVHAGFSSVNQLDKTYTIKNPRKKKKTYCKIWKVLKCRQKVSIAWLESKTMDLTVHLNRRSKVLFCSLLVRSDSFVFDLLDPSLSKQHMQL